MDKQQAQQIIKETFENPFDKDKFIYFIKNLFNSIEETPFSYRGNLIPDAYEQHISTLERIGKYTDGEYEIDILIVKLKKETTLERARTKQRNFVAWYLNGSRGGKLKDASLVAFVSPNEKDWRFSLVKMDYKFEEGKNGKIKVKEEFTPARRWSFLVGKNEKSHTAQSRLVSILADDKYNPTLSQFEEAFNIEKVTKEFFEKYRDIFLRTKETLDDLMEKDKKIKSDFEAKGVNTIDFSKKLLGQIVFLYFLQKKGWFGVKRDADWGTGDKHFLRELFEEKHCKYKNFFNDILEPLFYEAFRINRSHDDDYYSRFDCKIPFLNGGLFDPINNYNWVHTDILFPNELFSNNYKTKEGDTGNGILDIFDRYNFTVKEDEPLEKEVAIDPEMLGKVFENLLEVKDRKSKGTYYTPREIVHYMCQQSLINYLYTELNQGTISYEKVGDSQLDAFGNKAKTGQLVLTAEHKSYQSISRKEIETLIKYGEQVSGNEAMVETKGKETKTYSYKLSENIRKNAKIIDDKLANIKVCDPAIGSGAFPVGMMTEIVKTRNVLTAYLSLRGAEATKQSKSHSERSEESRSIYNFKRECIEKSLYGVDIDSSAVEIAKLRLWLSLVVDEDDIKQIKPLPNLDYKIVCGHSLFGVRKDVLNWKLFEELENLKPLLFNETNPNKKQKYKKQIDDIISQITDGHKEFDFEVYFSEVFHKKKGFDVVIANPPYVRQEEIKEYKPLLQKAGYEVYNSTSDLYTYFYELSYNILAPSRFSCFISSNKWMRAKYGEKLRNFFKTKTKVINLIDFGGHKVFETATVDTNILLLQKEKPQPEYTSPYINVDSDFTGENLDEYVSKKQQTIKQNELSDSGWTLADDKVLALKKKIEKIGTPLKNWDVKINRGIITGFNEAFIIDTATKERLCAEASKSVEIIKPILRGRDIDRYCYKWAGLWLIFIPWHFPLQDDSSIQGASKKAEREFQKQYPSVYNHLLQFKENLSKRNKEETGIRYEWYALQRCAATYLEDFEKEKIAWAETAQEIKMALVPKGFYLQKTCFMITGNNLKFIQAITNSFLLHWYTLQSVHRLGEKGIYLSGYFVEQLPIPKISERQQKPFINLVDHILSIHEQYGYPLSGGASEKVRELERQIDQMIYKLYDLTDEEIAIVKQFGTKDK
ncbi:MAG: Eco57I restriction-modification methylase domain-containing protein [Elusimicrobiota bacterium]